MPKALLNLLVILLLLAAAGRARAQGNWELIWSDEFDGTTIDATKWNVRNAPGQYNNELQYYSPDNVSVSDGSLRLRSERRTVGGRHYASGLVESRQKFAQMYGRVEIRAKLPSTQGMWPALWMLPENGQWPPEIDIVELIGQAPTTVYLSHHWGVYPQHSYQTTTYTGPDFTADYHVFVVEWSPVRIQWFVDGALRATHTVSIPAMPMFLIMNTAVGGDLPGPPNGSTVFPQEHAIDYVRVYTRPSLGTPAFAFTDTTPAGATVDGQMPATEYAARLNGINTGFGDRIGTRSVLGIDSDDQGWLYLGIDGFTAWPGSPTNDGVVFYIDSVTGGFTSTITLNDTGGGADLGRSLTSGVGQSTGVAADLFFPPSFAADYAIFVQDTFAGVFRLGVPTHQFVTGIALDAQTDVFGGTSIRYVRGSDPTIRELRVRLADLEVGSAGRFDLLATQLNGGTGVRSNEFFGATTGNAFDSVPSSSDDIQLKLGDFIRFTTVALAPAPPACSADYNADGVLNSDDLSDLITDYFNAQPPAQADFNGDGVVNADDLGDFIAAFFNGC